MSLSYKYSISLFLLGLLAPVFRCIAQEETRRKISINELWEFSKADTSKREAWTNINLPHTWNAHDVEDTQSGYYRGVGWYKRKITFADVAGHQITFIYFEGANIVTELFVNGVSAGVHHGGYTGFCFDISKLIKPGIANELLVKVSNSPDLNELPISADFTFYGGIYRNVYLNTSSDVHFDVLNSGSSGVFIQTPQVSKALGTVILQSRIINDSWVPSSVEFVTEIKNGEGKVIKSASTMHDIKAQDSLTVNTNALTVQYPRLWSPGDPYLYSVTVKLIDAKTRKLIDEVYQPLGFRWFKFDAGKGFFLNGSPLKLIGTSRHQDRKGLGNALPDELQEQDIRLIKEMGANFIRIAHYPQSPQILEMCDRYGLLVWEEVPVVNEINTTSEFAGNAKNALTEMIRQNYNHPSIIIWGFMNEVFATNKMRKIVDRKELLSKTTELAINLQHIAKQEDPSRSTAMALEYVYAKEYFETGIAKVCDVVGWNLYIGWYQPDMEKFGPFIDQCHQNLPDKPIIISEFGAGSDIRIHSLHPRQNDYSIEYQEQLLKSYLQQIDARPFIAGAAIWTSFDFNSEARTMDVTPYINNKGLMTTDRLFKDSYFLVQATLSRKPILKIASQNWISRTGRSAGKNKNYCFQPVQVYSNVKQAELFLNGKSLGIKTIINHQATWSVPFVNGQNKLFISSSSPSRLADQLDIDFHLQPFLLRESLFKEIDVRLNSKTYYIRPLDGSVWEPERSYTKGYWGYTSIPATSEKTQVRFDVANTNDDPLFYEFRENLSEVKFDVAAGTYEVDLLLVDKINGHQFNIKINNEVVYRYPAGQERSAVIKKCIVSVTGNSGLSISFDRMKGTPILSAIKIKKLNN